MTKGQRKRSNKKTTTKKTKGSSKKETSKKSTNVVAKNVLKNFAVKPLKQEQVSILKESVELSNRLAKLINQQQQKHNHLAMSKSYAKRLRKGDVKAPVMKQVAGNIFETIDDLSELADMIDNENDEIEKSIDIVHGQLSHWYDEYVDSLVRDYLMLKKLLGKILDEEKVSDVKGHYRGIGKEAKQAEEKAFMKEFDAQNLSEDDKKEIRKLVKNNASTPRKSGKKDS